MTAACRKQMEYERRIFAGLSSAEQEARWRQREKWLMQEFIKHPHRATVIDKCPNCAGITLVPRSYPAFYRCLTCRILIAADMGSHLCNDDVLRILAIDLDLLQEATCQSSTEN